MLTRKTPAVRIALAAASLALALVPVALAGNGHGGGGKPNGGGTCTPAAPGIVVQNTYAWGQWGSWGYPGQRLGYFIQVNGDMVPVFHKHDHAHKVERIKGELFE